MQARLGFRRRLGFGMIEVIVLLAAAAIIAVLTAAALAQTSQLDRIQKTWTILERTRLGEFNVAAPAASSVAFFQDVGRNPQLLSHLVKAIVFGDKDACGNSYTGGQRGLWAGPYGGFTIDAAVGLPTPIGNGNNTLVRNPTGTGFDTLAVLFPQIDVNDALLLDQVFDNANGNTLGSIKWTAPVLGLTDMRYAWAISAAC